MIQNKTKILAFYATFSPNGATPDNFPTSWRELKERAFRAWTRELGPCRAADKVISTFEPGSRHRAILQARAGRLEKRYTRLRIARDIARRDSMEVTV